MKKILLVEDDPFLIEIYLRKLKEADFEATSAVDGEQCLKSMEESIPDLVLLDLVLPNVDGWEILKKIKKDGRFKDVKIVILSNLGQKEDLEKGNKMGVERYLIKAQHAPSEVVDEVKKILAP